MIDAKIIEHSINKSNKELVTFEIVIPKWLLAELNTHRVLTKSASSSRAIPSKIIRKQVLENPFIPIQFGYNKSGMSSDVEMKGIRLFFSKRMWLVSRYFAVFFHWLLADVLKVHKQIVNRILETWMFAKVVVTGSEWDNFFKLRTASNAQPEFRFLAILMQSKLKVSKPKFLSDGEWHLPYITIDEKYTYDKKLLVKMSVARCARTSYYKNNINNIDKDIELFYKLLNDEHNSPFEHIATPIDTKQDKNFIGWMQYRSFIERKEDINV